MSHAIDYRDVPLGVECAWPAAPAAPTAVVRRPAHAWRLAALVALAFGLWQVGQAAYIEAKARLAQVLIGQAWERTLAGEAMVKPWPWADTWPVARLTVPDRDADLYVLAGADGRALAFGPGHVHGTPLPGQAGNSAIGGHRDTHLRFLESLRLGDRLHVQRTDGKEIEYRVENLHVTDKHDLTPLDPAGPTRLTLVTCWPFDAVRPGGPERYIVTAVAQKAPE